MVERYVRDVEAAGSNPVTSTRNISVVLVDCCDVDNNGNPIKDYRWFRVPINFKD